MEQTFIWLKFSYHGVVVDTEQQEMLYKTGIQFRGVWMTSDSFWATDARAGKNVNARVISS